MTGCALLKENSMDIEKRIKNHKYLSYIELDDQVIVWNRYYPSVLQFGKRDFADILSLITSEKKRQEYSSEFFNEMNQQHILYPLDFQVAQQYKQGIYEYLESKEKEQMNSVRERKPYSSVQFFNEECNLNCSYCIMKHTWGASANNKKKRFSINKTWGKIKNIIDAQYQAMKEHQKEDVLYSLNGGEFLLHYELTKNIIHYIRKVKGDASANISVNSNGTLLDDEKIKFLKENNVAVFLSIDGPEIHHNSTRVFHNNKGSFDDIMASHKLLKKNEYQVGESLEAFQGTIDNVELLDPEDMFKLGDLGFKRARFSPNLIDISEEEARKKAEFFFDLYMKSPRRNLEIFDDLFNFFKDVYTEPSNESYVPFCIGLSSLGGARFSYNITADTCSCLCQYVVDASQKMTDSSNIFDLGMVRKSLDFQKKRAETLIRECWQCPIIGICRGGCVIYGFSADNMVNKAACEYMRTLWFLYALEMNKCSREN